MPELPNPEDVGGYINPNDATEEVFVKEFSAWLVEQYPWLEQEIAEIAFSTDGEPYHKSEMLGHLWQVTEARLEEVRSTIGPRTISSWSNLLLDSAPNQSAATYSRRQKVGKGLLYASAVLFAGCAVGVTQRDYNQAVRAGVLGVTLYSAGKNLDS